jgi:hypothetical protein
MTHPTQILVRMENTNASGQNLAAILPMTPAFKKGVVSAKGAIRTIKRGFDCQRNEVSVTFALHNIPAVFEFDLPRNIQGQLNQLGYAMITEGQPAPTKSQLIEFVEAKTQSEGDTYLHAWSDVGYLISSRIPFILIREEKNEQVQGN